MKNFETKFETLLTKISKNQQEMLKTWAKWQKLSQAWKKSLKTINVVSYGLLTKKIKCLKDLETIN